jgi:hypothetical protein
VLLEELRHPPDELLLGAAAEPFLRERLVGPIGRLAGPPHRIQLLRLLDCPQRLDEAAPRDEVGARLLEELVVGVRERVSLEPDAVGESSLEVAVDVPLDLLHLDALDFSGPLGVAEIREDPDAVWLDEDRCVGALEAGQIEDIDRRRDEQRLLELLPQAGYPRANDHGESLDPRK